MGDSATLSHDNEQRTKSCNTACSSNSSCFFQKRKPINPLAASLRSTSRSTGNGVRQRVLSAKLLRMKSVQNQLNDANFHLAEVMRENQALKILQKRQDRALSKYEGTQAELPRLIKSHEEEIRILTEKNKVLRKSVRELGDQLKHKSDELTNLQELLKHYEKLDKDRHLLQREKLLEELEDYKSKLQKADEEIVILNRKLSLESKTSKQRLNTEMAKHKQCQRDLAKALMDVGKLNKLVDAKPQKRFVNLMQRQAVSLINLNKGDDGQSEVKLEPIITTKTDIVKGPKSILKCPSENIKARLSRSEDKISSSGSESSLEKSRPNSSHKLKKIEIDLQNTIKKVEKDEDSQEIDKSIGDYCLKAIESVKNYGHVIDNHRENLENARADTNILVESVKEAENLEMKLKRSTLLSALDDDLNEENLNFVTQILTEELTFQRKYKKDKDEDRKDPGINEKKKLLATLRAIDNGDNVDSFDQGSEKNNKLMKELFGEDGV